MADDADDLELEVKNKGGVSKKTLILVVAISLLVMILGIVTTVMIMSGKNKSGAKAPDAKVEATGGHDAPAEGGHGDDSHGSTVGKKQDAMYYDIKSPFIINYLTEKGRIRYAQIHVQLLTRSSGVQEALAKNLPLIQDDLVRLFSAADFDQIQTFEGKEKLKAAALGNIQNIMQESIGKPGVEAVLFTSFVVQ